LNTEATIGVDDWFVISALSIILSPGTYPRLSRRIAVVTGPFSQQRQQEVFVSFSDDGICNHIFYELAPSGGL